MTASSGRVGNFLEDTTSEYGSEGLVGASVEGISGGTSRMCTSMRVPEAQRLGNTDLFDVADTGRR